MRAEGKGFFVTATDTSVGKTVITAALIKALVYLGYRTGTMKPIETGCIRREGMLIPSDGMFLKAVSGMSEKISLITPFTYERPLAPMVAAEIEGYEVDIQEIMRSFDLIRKDYEAVVVEGVGGLYVPVKRDYFISDLAKEMGLPLIIVSRPSLGTLNHTLLTVGHALSSGLEVAGIIINYSMEPEMSIAEETNVKALKDMTDVPIIGVFPNLRDLEEETLSREALRSIDLDVIKRAMG